MVNHDERMVERQGMRVATYQGLVGQCEARAKEHQDAQTTDQLGVRPAEHHGRRVATHRNVRLAGQCDARAKDHQDAQTTDQQGVRTAKHQGKRAAQHQNVGLVGH